MKQEKEWFDNCPFCNHDKVRIVPRRIGKYSREGTNYQVLCNSCFARGSLKSNKFEARIAWNSWGMFQ